MISTIARGPIESVSPRAWTKRLTPREPLDTILLERIAARDAAAMKVLYGRHSVRVYRFVLRLVDNPATAEDLVSEVFLDVWRSAGKFEGRSQVSSWLLAIARHKAFATMRRPSTEPLKEAAYESIEDTSDTPEAAVQKKQTGSILTNCLTRLSAAHREIVDLVYYHGKSIGEVAEITGLARGTVKKRMFYARKRLAKLLGARGIVAAAA